MTQESNAADFHNLHAMDEFKLINHNDTDFDSFKTFQANMDARFGKLEKERAKKEIKANLKRWEEMLPSRWSGAILTQINEPADRAAGQIIRLLADYEHPSLFIKGPSGSGKTYLAYATARRFIGLNWARPSQIKLVSEEMLMGFAASGFEGQNRFNEILNSRYVLYIFDGIGSKANYSPKEQQMWEQIIDHIYSKDLTAIFTSNKSADSFAAHLSDSAESKLAHLIDGKIIEVEANGSAPALTSTAASTAKHTTHEKDSYDLFKD